MSHRVRLGVKVMIIFGFIDAHAPQNNGRMVPIPPDHAAHVVDRERLPRIVSNMLPARNLFQHQQTHLITGVQKMPGLRIVRGADDVAAQIVLHDVRVLSLCPLAHGIAGIGEGLVAVETAELECLAVELEAFRRELHLAEAEGVGGPVIA